MAKKDKYEVVDFASGNGWFVHGGNQGENFFKHEADARQVADALNMMERLKTRKFVQKLGDLLNAAEVLDKALQEGTEDYY